MHKVIFEAPIKEVKKGWGKEVWLANSALYCSKILYVHRGLKCSIHYHHKKTETFFMLEGAVYLEVEGTKVQFNEGDMITIHPYQLHRFTGIDTVSKILEVSTQHFEDDSVRTERGD